MLFGTNFDFCDLEGSNFSIHPGSIQSMNWLGQIYLTLDEHHRMTTKIDCDLLIGQFNLSFQAEIRDTLHHSNTNPHDALT